MAYLEIDLHSAITVAFERLGLRPQTWRGPVATEGKASSSRGSKRAHDQKWRTPRSASKRTSWARCVNLVQRAGDYTEACSSVSAR